MVFVSMLIFSLPAFIFLLFFFLEPDSWESLSDWSELLLSSELSPFDSSLEPLELFSSSVADSIPFAAFLAAFLSARSFLRYSLIAFCSSFFLSV